MGLSPCEEVFVMINRLHGRHRWGNVSVPASLLLVLSVLLGFAARGPAAEPPPAKSTASPNDFDALAKDIQREVAELGYPDNVAQDFVVMVRDWGIAAVKRKLVQAREDQRAGKVSKDEVVQAERDAARTLVRQVREKMGPSWDNFDLADVIKDRKATCLGNSQLFWALGTSLGLPVKVLVVLEPARGSYAQGVTHAACLVDLADGRTIMADATGFGSLLAEFFGTDCVSRPFVLLETFGATGDRYEIKNKANPMGLHRRIRVMDRSGLVALLESCRGMVCGGKGDYGKAIAEFTEAMRLSPKWPEVYYDRGWAYTGKGDYDKAAADYSEAVRLAPESTDAYQGRAYVYQMKGEYDKAIADYASVIRLDPKNALAYCGRGCAYGRKGDYRKEISDCTVAIRLDPKYTLAYVTRGRAYGGNGNYDKEIADCTEAIRLDAKSADAYSSRGWAYGCKGDFDKEIADCTEAIRLDANCAEAYYSRGCAYGSKCDYDKAIADCTDALRLDPNRAEAYYSRGCAYACKCDYDKAVADCSEAIRLIPKFAGGHNALAWLLATCPEGKVRNGRIAVEHAQKAVELAHGADTLDTLAAAWAECGDFQAAIKWQRKAIELKPDADRLKEFQEHLMLYEEHTPCREKPSWSERPRGT
jgi:tetratricopeptide (TPR) repeat protein